MENLVYDFWFPTENFVLQVAFLVNENIKVTGLDIKDMLDSVPLALIASYCISTFFLITVLHGTRVIDVRLLR